MSKEPTLRERLATVEANTKDVRNAMFSDAGLVKSVAKMATNVALLTQSIESHISSDDKKKGDFKWVFVTVILTTGLLITAYEVFIKK